MVRGNNYGLRTRDMAKAGVFAANAAARDGHVSYASARALGDRWRLFAEHARTEGVRRMEGVTRELVIAYGQQLADRAQAGELSPSYAQNALSAVNTVMRLASQGKWQRVSPLHDCGIAQRTGVRHQVPEGLDRGQVALVADQLRNCGQKRGAAVLELCRDFGLRSKEASLLDATRAAQEARTTGQVTISAGTKGGRTRTVPITDAGQLATLGRAAAAQGAARSLVPPEQRWAQWRYGGLRDVREALQAAGVSRIHELRAAYAADRYHQITDHAIPLLGGRAPRNVDRAARMQIAQELGHGRIDVISAYIGGAQ